MATTPTVAPELRVQGWLNTSEPLSISGLKGKVVVLHAFQMLCPGCVSHGIPQAQSLDKYYQNSDVVVIGLHSVFEHHEVMDEAALKAFVHEYRLSFPIAIDKPGTTSLIPQTMAQYKLQGTPSLVLIDREGRIRLNHFGRISDLALGDRIATLVAEHTGTPEQVELTETTKSQDSANCDTNGCPI